MNKKIVVLYKKTGQAPVLKIITDMYEIKKMIVQGNLNMVKYENYIIVCNNKNIEQNQIPNIILDFKHIAGDFFLIGYDEKAKDFRSLSKDETTFYADALDRKSFQYENYKKWLKKCCLVAENSNKTDYIAHKITIQKPTREIGENEESETTSSYSEKMLEMILSIQAIILRYLKNSNGEK